MHQIREYAISLRQPWATLLVHGLKTIEVRRWPTARRGRVLIHAARIPDDRPEAWSRVPEPLLENAQLRGGIVGAAEITSCQSYRNLEDFLEDQAKHLNEPGWFEAAGLYGFAFANPEVLAFRKYPGWMRFFPVDPGPFIRRKKPEAS
jgi:hypothetical protein